MTPTLIKSLVAAAAIGGNRLVAIDAAGKAVAAAANTDAIIGISERVGAKENGMADIVQGGWYEVVAGGDITPGDPITANVAGAAVPAVPAVGTVVRYVGFAMTDGAVGDLGPVFIAPGIINTP